MPERGPHRHHRGQKGMSSRPRDLALLALEALVRYKNDLALPGETYHEGLAQKLAKVATRDSWE